MAELRIKRIYEQPSRDDGFRVLIDRLWPRGKSQADAALDLWLKEIAPSTELRQWFHHDPSQQEEFARRYEAELDGNPAVEELRAVMAEHPVVTLLYSARDTQANQAIVLKAYLEASPA
jgi:DNA-3-methyladenine glycosylase